MNIQHEYQKPQAIMDFEAKCEVLKHSIQSACHRMGRATTFRSEKYLVALMSEHRLCHAKDVEALFKSSKALIRRFPVWIDVIRHHLKEVDQVWLTLKIWSNPLTYLQAGEFHLIQDISNDVGIIQTDILRLDSEMPSKELVKTKDTQTRALLQIPLNMTLAMLWKNAVVCLQLLRLISLLMDASSELKSEEIICNLKVQYLTACQEMTKCVQNHCHELILRCMEFLTLLDKRPDVEYLHDWLKHKEFHTSYGELSTGMLDSGVCDKESNYEDLLLSSELFGEEFVNEDEPVNQQNRSQLSYSLDTLLCSSTRGGLIFPEFAHGDTFTCGPQSFASNSHNFSSRRILSSPQLYGHWESFSNSTNHSNTTITGRLQNSTFDKLPHQLAHTQSDSTKRTLLSSDCILASPSIPQFTYIPTPSYASYSFRQHTRNEDFVPIKGSLAAYEESLLNFNHRLSSSAKKRKIPNTSPPSTSGATDGSFSQIILPNGHIICLLLTSWIIICIFSFWMCLFLAISYHHPFGVPF